MLLVIPALYILMQRKKTHIVIFQIYHMSFYIAVNFDKYCDLFCSYRTNRPITTAKYAVIIILPLMVAGIFLINCIKVTITHNIITS